MITESLCQCGVCVCVYSSSAFLTGFLTFENSALSHFSLKKTLLSSLFRHDPSSLAFGYQRLLQMLSVSHSRTQDLGGFSLFRRRAGHCLLHVAFESSLEGRSESE